MRVLILLAALAAPFASAQTPGSCSLGTDQEFLSANEVRAAVYNTGGLFFGGSTTNGEGYVVPKNRGTSPLFAMSLWVGGMVSGNVRTSGTRYSGHQFWPGPLNEGATLPESDCSVYDRIYSVTRQDISTYEATANAPTDLAEWPVELGAPVIDGDGLLGNYNLAGGDRPQIGGPQSEQGVFWVMNDVGGPRSGASSQPLGIEVRVLAFAGRSVPEPAIHYGTFYRYEIINRNTVPITSAHVGFYVDPDVGSSSDDYIGSDPARGMAFAYNASPSDPDYIPWVPPAVGVDLLSGAGSVIYYDGSGATSAPTSSAAYYNSLKGLWGDGTPIREGGTGYGGTGAETSFVYSGDPVSGAFWSEVNVDGNGTENGSGDRRLAISTPAFDLPAGGTYIVDVAVLTAEGTSHLNSVTVLKGMSDRVQAGYDAQTFFPVDAEEAPSEVTDLVASPNPVQGIGTVRYRLASPSPVELAVVDVLGRQVLELVSARQPEGAHTATLDASALAPGVYVVRLRAGDETRSSRITVVR